jgi:hypothetical protein
MPATYPFTEPRPEADALVESLARWLQSTSVHCALGLLIGGLATRFLRRRQLHWSWGAAPLAAALLIRPSLGSFSSTLAVAGISATAWGRRWHREDLQAGADLARHALGRRGRWTRCVSCWTGRRCAGARQAEREAGFAAVS